MAFKCNLARVFDMYDFETISADIQKDFADVAGAAGLSSAKVGAPVGDPLEDPFSGQLRDSLYRITLEQPHRTVVKIAIPIWIRYAFPIVFGNKHRQPNGFMLKAKEDAYLTAKAHFKKITRDALMKMNAASRGIS